ncbi:hypothetical protein [Dryocola sp. BD613]|uniref:hypothetical protein n=1 Tax=Dryocola sp. BD613 TaxID=3133272 RepID=UPI003F4FADA6
MKNQADLQTSKRLAEVMKRFGEFAEKDVETRLALLSTDKGATCLWILEATYEEWKADNARKAK